MADAAENFQKAHRWQDNIKVRTVVAFPGPGTFPPPARVDVNAGEKGREAGSAEGSALTRGNEHS